MPPEEHKEAFPPGCIQGGGQSLGDLTLAQALLCYPLSGKRNIFKACPGFELAGPP